MQDNICLAIILDMIADNLALEITQLEEDNEGLGTAGLLYIVEQIEEYVKWARGVQ